MLFTVHQLLFEFICEGVYSFSEDMESVVLLAFGEFLKIHMHIQVERKYMSYLGGLLL